MTATTTPKQRKQVELAKKAAAMKAKAVNRPSDEEVILSDDLPPYAQGLTRAGRPGSSTSASFSPSFQSRFRPSGPSCARVASRAAAHSGPDAVAGNRTRRVDCLASAPAPEGRPGGERHPLVQQPAEGGGDEGGTGEGKVA